jgi:hypothetical protein
VEHSDAQLSPGREAQDRIWCRVPDSGNYLSDSFCGFGIHAWGVVEFLNRSDTNLVSRSIHKALVGAARGVVVTQQTSTLQLAVRAARIVPQDPVLQ